MKRLIAEFEQQSYTQLIFPHEKTDWAPYLDEVQECFVNIINIIRRFQPCLVVCYDLHAVKQFFQDTHNLKFIQYETDDTWARDCSAITIDNNGKKELLDFCFNGWGGKFDAKKDDAMTAHLSEQAQKVEFILEGGAIDSNGKGLLLTTTACMHNPNRNNTLSSKEITQKLQEFFGISEVLYLHHGYLAGDDTDSHIDTLARFIDEKTIMYVACRDKEDEHYGALKKMEEELQNYAKQYNLSLVALPMTPPIYYSGERLPATYANFLFVNGAVLVPTYGEGTDEEALAIFQKHCSEREVVGVDARVLIRQHGSLHCVTMNFA